MPQAVAPPDGCARTATPAKPTPTPTSAGQRQPLAPARRSTTTQSGTEAMISEASPVGTSALGEEQDRVRAGQQCADHDARDECPPRDAQRAAAQSDDADHQRAGGDEAGRGREERRDRLAGVLRSRGTSTPRSRRP